MEFEEKGQLSSPALACRSPLELREGCPALACRPPVMLVQASSCIVNHLVILHDQYLCRFDVLRAESTLYNYHSLVGHSLTPNCIILLSLNGVIYQEINQWPRYFQCMSDFSETFEVTCRLIVYTWGHHHTTDQFVYGIKRIIFLFVPPFWQELAPGWRCM